MSGIGSDIIPKWSRDVWDLLVPPRCPFVGRSIGNREWDAWSEAAECSGLWETQDPFPPRIALIWDELMMMHAPYPYNAVTQNQRAKVLMAWEKRCTSARVRIEMEDYPSFNHSLLRDGALPTTDLFVGHGEIAKVKCWRGSDCWHRYHPYPGCRYSARAVAPVPPRLDMHYWLAQIQDGDHQFRAVLETPLRVDLGARGPVYVCWSQQILEWFLPRAARKLDRYWDKLPLLIGRAQIEGLFFRATQSKF